MNDLDALWGFLTALVVALLATPLVMRLARRVGAVVKPHERGLHDESTPGLGGVAILAAVLVAGVVFLPWNGETRAILAGAAVIVVVGAVDDGVDGLAAGVCTIAAATFAVIALSLDRTGAAVLAAITAGAAIGFLRHNFHPASIFMGDSGANLLGLLLAVVAVQGLVKTAAVVALVFPLVVLAVPMLDTGFVMAKRIKYRRPVWEGDRWHFHHRLSNIGFSQRRTVLYLYGWTLTLAALALALRFVPYSDDDGTLNAGWAAVMTCFGVIALAASVYLVLVLEILKFRRFREREIRRQVETGEIPALTNAQIEHEIEREVETGEVEPVRPPETDEFEAVGRE